MSTSWYRRSLFNYKGNREYTRTGYEAASTRFVEDDLDVDCSDRHYMITGSNSGIGLETALEVAKRGGIIHMVCRNKEAATQARSLIITTTGNDKIYLHIVDLSKPRDVILWAQKFAAQHENLHVLIHNAGCMVHERRIDEDGVEFNFAVNTLAVHILTLTFMPLLQRSDDARVVTVSSAGLLTVRLDPHDLMHANLETFNGRAAYSQHKRQQVVMTLWYAQHYNKVHFSSMHPGWADTNAVRTSIPEFYEMMKDNLRTPAQGADTVVWLAISKSALKHPGGLFFQDREPVSTHFPLAWTKSTIEEDDFLLTNIQKVYSEIYNKIYNPDGTPAAAPSTPEQEPSTDKPQESTKEESTEHKPDKPDPETVPFPVLPPPPPPADRGVKSEVQEGAEIHSAPGNEGKENRDTEQKEESTEEFTETQDLKANQSPKMQQKPDSEEHDNLTLESDKDNTPTDPIESHTDTETKAQDTKPTLTASEGKTSSEEGGNSSTETPEKESEESSKASTEQVVPEP